MIHVQAATAHLDLAIGEQEETHTPFAGIIARDPEAMVEIRLSIDDFKSLIRNGQRLVEKFEKQRPGAGRVHVPGR